VALELNIAGPGLDFTRRLQPGDPALVLGRDADCTICLPDPERNVSRRHLSVWNEGDELHFHVLSVVNGVDLPAGPVPPGARGVLTVGQSLLVSAYRLTVSMVAGTDEDADPWAVLEREAAATTPLPRPFSDALDTMPMEDDPFGDWGFGSTFGPGAPGGPLSADALEPAQDLKPFFQGLGVDAGAAAMTQGELETIGRITRMAVTGMLHAMQAANLARQDLRSGDRTMLGARETNPLLLDGPLEAKLHYLFGGRAAAAGFGSPDRAMADLAGDLLAHQEAVGHATRSAFEGVLKEFEPEALKLRLLGPGGKLFESARAWDAFSRDYAEQRADIERWAQKLIERHFVDAYLREIMRVKRETSSRRK
jgi:predicted component of type VI protein secretion system